MMWMTIAEVANAARLTATVAPDRIIADQASFPIRMWKGFQIVLVISSYFNEIGRNFWGIVCKPPSGYARQHFVPKP